MNKKLLLAAIFFCGAISAHAQFSCTGAVPMANGFTTSNVTTPGLGAGSPGAWVTSSIDCQGTGGQSSTLGANTTCWNQVFDTGGDDYVFSYTTGNTDGESVYFEIVSRQSYVGIMAFTECNGTSLSGCLSGAYTASVGAGTATLSVAASGLPANQTIYFGVGVWTMPNDLDFDVTEFTVTPSLGAGEMTAQKIMVYPNPVTDVLHFENIHENSEISVYNLLGQRVVDSKVNNGRLDVSYLSAGTYLVSVRAHDLTQTFKIVKN